MENTKPPADGGPNRPLPTRPRVNPSSLWFMILLVALGAFLYFGRPSANRSEIPYWFFVQQVQAGNVAEVEFDGQTIYGEFRKRPVAPQKRTPEKTTAEQPALDTALSKAAANKAAQPTIRDATPGKDSTAAKSPAGSKDVPPPPPTEARAHEELLLPQFVVTILPIEDRDLVPLLRKQGVEIKAVQPADNTFMLLLLYLFVPLLLFIGLWVMMRRTRDQFLGGGILSGFSKSPAKRYEDGGRKPITFNDVAGLEGVKHDLQEIVEFLKNPEKFQRLGGRVPKGVLLMGPPGTGKTLLARAVAGEAGVPFFSISGSEFIQMFVGVGASRVRDMFKTAKDAAPCILFIDEIDAVGRHRGAGLGGGHDEREQTLNQILSEMDGFSQNESVIVLAATNRLDVLDPALLRPGRFDRHITVDRPNYKARVAIYKVHTRDVPLGPDVDLNRLAGGTVGLTGADIRNLVNEAALWATRNGKDRVEMEDFEYARDKVLMGPKREELLTGKEKKMTAYHEAGHALLAWILPGVDRLHKVTIIPRGRALGVTQLVPEEDRLSIGQSELQSRLVFMLGGRGAEKLIFNELSAGAENDLTQVTKLARKMVAHWGMSERVGPVAFHTSEEHPFLGREIYEHREFSEHSARVIDEEVSRILHEADARAQDLLSQHRQQLEALAGALEQREVLDENEVAEIIGPSPFPRGISAAEAENGKPGAAAADTKLAGA